MQTPIVHVQQAGRPGGVFDVTGRGGRIIDKVAPGNGEDIVRKSLPNAFAHTVLADTLAGLGCKHLIFAGFMTHMCVSATARAALDLGFQSTIVSDAVATRALPDPLNDGVLSAAAINEAELAALADRFAVVAPAGAIRA